MDTLFNPFYWEDIYLSYRAQKAGWKILFEPKSIVRHFHDQGAIKTSYSQNDIKRIVYRNQYIFIWKNISDTSLIFSHIIWTPIRLIQGILRGDILMIEGYIWALCKFWAVWTRRRNASKLWKVTDSELFKII